MLSRSYEGDVGEEAVERANYRYAPLRARHPSSPEGPRRMDWFKTRVPGHTPSRPQYIQSGDGVCHGVPFASRAPGGLSRVSMRWVKLGIVPERSRPASPQDNGRHERMHLTLKQATLQPPARTVRRQQAAFDRFQHDSNHERPHAALDDQTPASCYTPSSRPMPRRVPELEYGDQVVVRRISQQGSLKMKGERTFVSEIFAYEWMGLRALDERYCEVFYGPVTVGFLDTFRHQFHRALSVSLRRRLGIEDR
jgi:hypothetical protein